MILDSISDIRLETHLGKESISSNNSNYGSRGALAWTPPASMEGSTPTWTEGTPSFTESSSSENGEIGKNELNKFIYFFFKLLIIQNYPAHHRLLIIHQCLISTSQPLKKPLTLLHPKW